MKAKYEKYEKLNVTVPASWLTGLKELADALSENRNQLGIAQLIGYISSVDTILHY